MGYDAVQFTVHARVSSHNDERDAEDREAWELFQLAVRELATDPDFKRLEVWV